MVLAAATTAVVLSRRTASPVHPTCTLTSTPASSQYSLSPDQAQNAAIIAAVAVQKNMPDHAVTVALAAALQESELRNLPGGDRDSVGLFQQRPSQGWGSPTQLLDPAYAAAAFYDGLVKVSGWESMAVTDAAQAVQRSAAPSAYAAWEGEARALAIALTGEIPAGLTCHFSGFAGKAPLPTALGQALSNEIGSDLLGIAVPAKTGWTVASWSVAHAYTYHVTRVVFAGRTWQASTGKWTSSPSPSPTDVVTVTSK